MSDETQTMLHAVPLLALAVLYGVVSILLGISLVRERRTSWFGVGIWLLFALVAAFVHMGFGDPPLGAPLTLAAGVLISGCTMIVRTVLLERRLGALLVEMPDGQRFRLGGGFTDAQRDDPPPVGSWVTYRYNGTHPGGLPRFARFLRVREDVVAAPPS